ncbi:MAG TPA: DNA polymerase III subunit gamma/tau [bacterium]|nr:DNA polymerase III subunit gamma/tau [bacterium]
MADSYQALARKWRPQTFDDVVAQPQVTTTLKNALASGRIHHAYLFCGPRGTGKTTTARILAKALNCEKGPTPTPCNECHACRSITTGSNLDVLEIDAASNTGVDQIRDLRDSTLYVPAQSRFKIYIIDEVHRLTSNAKDALLKTLEEPPPAVKFIFATTEAHEVPQTVRSRSLRLDFHLLSQDALRRHLQTIASNEKLDIEPGALEVIAAEAAGSVRDSLSLLDQIAAYAGGRVTVDLANEALGLVDTQILFAFTDAVARADVGAAIDAVGAVARAGRDYLQFARQLTEHLKRLLFAKTLGAKFSDEGLGAEDLERYRTTASTWEENDLLRLLLMALEVGQRVRRGAPQPRMELEIYAMRAARMESSIDLRALLKRLEAQGAAMPPAPRPAAPPAPPQARAPLPTKPMVRAPEPEPPLAPEPPRAAVGELAWEPILEAICEHRPSLRSVLGHAQIVRTSPGVFELHVAKSNEFQQRQLAEKSVRDLIHTETIRAIGQGARLSIHVKSLDAMPASAPIGASSPAPARPAKAADEQRLADHGLQEILRRFDGEIVE